jgi:hypothetical protein
MAILKGWDQNIRVITIIDLHYSAEKKYTRHIKYFIWKNMGFVYINKTNNTAVLTKWLAGLIFPADSNMLHTLDSRTSSRTLAASRISRIKSASKP